MSTSTSADSSATSPQAPAATDGFVITQAKRILVQLYAIRRLRPLVLWLLRRLDGDEYQSRALREIFRGYWGVEIGMYSMGACFTPWLVDPKTTIGRYCSFGPGIRIVNGNHPLSLKSTNAVFHNPEFGLCDDWIDDGLNPLEIGNDVWIGANAVILPEVNRIGHGAVIAAGAVVNKDVPDYGVVIGNPARLVKKRFSDETIATLLAEKWWDADVEALRSRLGEFQTPIQD